MPKFLFVLLVSLFCFACRNRLPQAQRPSPSQSSGEWVEWRLEELKALNIQSAVLGSDELLLIQTMALFEGGKLQKELHQARVFRKVKKGLRIPLDTLPALKLWMKPGQELHLGLALWETEHYQGAQKLMRQINGLGMVLQGPLTLVEWTQNPLAWLFTGARLGSLLLDAMATADAPDPLGTSERWLPWEERAHWKKAYPIRWKEERWSKGSYLYELKARIR